MFTYPVTLILASSRFHASTARARGGYSVDSCIGAGAKGPAKQGSGTYNFDWSPSLRNKELVSNKLKKTCLIGYQFLHDIKVARVIIASTFRAASVATLREHGCYGGRSALFPNSLDFSLEKI